LPKLQVIRAGKEADANIQSPKSSRPVFKTFQAQIILFLEILNVKITNNID